MIFVDTSALYALLDADQDQHAAAADVLPRLLASDQLVTHNYVVVEATALTQRRLGLPAVRALHDDLLGPITVTWVEADVHAAALGALLTTARRGLSLVDLVSFETIRRLGCDTAFAFDAGFSAQGFRVVP